MTSETLGVVEEWIALQSFMGIMTGGATDPLIIDIVSRAIKESIRLKTDIIHSALSWHDHRLLEAGVTCAAE